MFVGDMEHHTPRRNEFQAHVELQLIESQKIDHLSIMVRLSPAPYGVVELYHNREIMQYQYTDIWASVSKTLYTIKSARNLGVLDLFLSVPRMRCRLHSQKGAEDLSFTDSDAELILQRLVVFYTSSNSTSTKNDSFSSL